MEHRSGKPAPAAEVGKRRRMRLTTRFKRLTLWNKLGAIGAICSILAFLGWLLWPEGTRGTTVQIDADRDAVVQAPVHSPGAIVQNMSDSPGGTQFAVGQVDRMNIISTVSPRQLPDELRTALATRLAALEPMRVGMTVPIGDAEARTLGLEIKSLLMGAGWPVPLGLVAAEWETPIWGCQMIFQSPPGEEVAAVFAEMLDALQEPKKLLINPGQREGTLQINIGPRRSSSEKSLEPTGAPPTSRPQRKID